MSQRRNTPSLSSRARNTSAAALALASLAACSAERISAPDVATHDATTAAPIAGASLATGTSSLTVIKSTKDATQRLADAALTTLAASWHTSFADTEAPTTKPLELTCGVQGSYTVRQRVGRSGGTLKFGASELRIPSGALSADTDISATISMGPGVRVDFQPHGLRFAKAAELRVDWTGCTQPSGATINTYYTNDYNRITQVMPSSSSSDSKKVRVLTDHFSGFVVGWGRSAAY